MLSHWQGERQRQLQVVIGLVGLVFLLAYASAQMVAGSKALHVLLKRLNRKYSEARRCANNKQVLICVELDRSDGFRFD